MILISGLSVGYFILGQIDGTWMIAVAFIATMFCSFFVQVGEGAVFAIPLWFDRALENIEYEFRIIMSR
jgi:nitrate/nitrite transporter NarK